MMTTARSALLPLLLLLLASTPPLALAFGPTGGAFPSLFVPDLTAANFNESLSDAPDVLVEFYAPWCPHCRHFAHDVERLGFTFNRGASAPRVAVRRVDCVANDRLCGRFGIDSYPTLKFGARASLAAYPGVEALGRAARAADAAAEALGHDTLKAREARVAAEAKAREALEARNGLVTLGDVPHTAEAVYAWVERRVGGNGTLPRLAPADAFESAFAAAARTLPVYSSPSRQVRVDTADVDVAVASTIRGIFANELALDSVRREHLQRFVQLLCTYYPRAECRPSLCDLAHRMTAVLAREDEDADDNDDADIDAERAKAAAAAAAAKGHGPAAVETGEQAAEPGDDEGKDYEDDMNDMEFPVGFEPEKPLPGERPGEDVLATYHEPHTYPLASMPEGRTALTMDEAQRQAERAHADDILEQGVAEPIVDRDDLGPPREAAAYNAADFEPPEERGRAPPVAVSLLQVAAAPPHHKLQGADLLEHEWQFCNRSWSDIGKSDWRSCKGTYPYMRGYTCGMWSLFHSLAARAVSSPAAVIGGIRDYVEQFFACADCRTHFLVITYGFERTVRTRRDAVLYLWRAHNEVNARVAKLEAEHGDGDPAFPKAQFPSPELCPLCRRKASKAAGHAGGGALQPGPDGEAWDLDVVYDFLTGFYGDGPARSSPAVRG